MELVTIVDEDNNKYAFKRYKGYPFTIDVVGNVRDQLDKIAHREIKQDDVLVAVFPKSGTHWLYNTVMMLRSGSLTYHGTPTMMEFQDFNLIEEMPSPRTFGSHLRFRFLPEQMKLGKGKVITITRHPKDLVVSMYHMIQKLKTFVGYEGTFEGLIKYFLSEDYFIGSWFSTIKDLEEWKSPNCLCLSYSDFRKNTFENVVKMAKFLEVDRDEDFLRSVTQNIQFEKLKESHIETTPSNDRWKEICDEGRLPIYRKGQPGEWKNMFTVAQSEHFDQVYAKKVVELGLKINFGYE
ncbi:sulfotransferase 4A1-like [Ylistrum balloti]|uniref:sulfotransferase 4A1-like n=1 Tax=Ylistrum balloti TaxID=509963 RepID=UPI002905F012|nr:sulfotransferase 4A1-like [Ylistrum balloti]